MRERQYLTLSKRIVDRLAVDGKDAVFWDRGLPGFGVRVYPSGRKVYVVQTRAGGKSRRVTVGRHGEIAPDRARKDAAKIIARLKAGLPPVETEPESPPTVADLAGRYRHEYVAMHCKPNTVKHYGLMLAKHIVPSLGDLRVSKVERKHILEFQYGLRDMPTVANRCADILVKMFNLAELWELRPPGRFGRWRATLANPRTHATTGRVVDEAFAEERPQLVPLPAVAHSAPLTVERRISRDGMVSVAGNLYSVPDATRRRVSSRCGTIPARCASSRTAPSSPRIPSSRAGTRAGSIRATAPRRPERADNPTRGRSRNARWTSTPP